MKLTTTLCAALISVAPVAGQAASITGSLAGFFEETQSTGEPINLGNAPFDFQAGFVNIDDADVFQFDFINNGSLALVSMADFTVNQTPNDFFFEDGVAIEFGPNTVTVPQGSQQGDFLLTETVESGETISLRVAYGDPVGTAGGLGQVGPDIDFVVTATPVPVPAALPMLAAALGGLGWLTRRRRRAAAK